MQFTSNNTAFHEVFSNAFQKLIETGYDSSQLYLAVDAVDPTTDPTNTTTDMTDITDMTTEPDNGIRMMPMIIGIIILACVTVLLY